MNGEKCDEAELDQKSFAVRMRIVMFCLKQSFVVVTIVWLLVVIAMRIL